MQHLLELHDDALYTARETCRFSGKSNSTLYADMAQGRFPRPVKVGHRSVRWRGSDIRVWRDSLAVAGGREQHQKAA